MSALLGPTLARNTADLLTVQFAGVYMALIVVYLAIATIVSFINNSPSDAGTAEVGGRTLSEIARQPKFIIAVCAATFGYLVMSFLMTVTPIAMAVCGFTFSDSSTGFRPTYSVCMHPPL